MTAPSSDGSRLSVTATVVDPDDPNPTNNSATATVKLLGVLSVMVKQPVNSGNTVTSQPAGISCPPTCQKAFQGGSSVTITSHPATRYFLFSWTGACTGSAHTCPTAMNSNESLVGTFRARSAGTLTLTPSSGAPGQQVSAQASGFASLEMVTVTFDGTNLGQVRTSAQGTLQTTVTIPLGTPAGTHTIALKGSNSGVTASATFTVT